MCMMCWYFGISFWWLQRVRLSDYRVYPVLRCNKMDAIFQPHSIYFAHHKALLTILAVRFAFARFSHVIFYMHVMNSFLSEPVLVKSYFSWSRYRVYPWLKPCTNASFIEFMYLVNTKFIELTYLVFTRMPGRAPWSSTPARHFPRIFKLAFDNATDVFCNLRSFTFTDIWKLKKTLRPFYNLHV